MTTAIPATITSWLKRTYPKPRVDQVYAYRFGGYALEKLIADLGTGLARGVLPVAGGSAADKPSRREATRGYDRRGLIRLRPEGLHAIGNRIPRWYRHG